MPRLTPVYLFVLGLIFGLPCYGVQSDSLQNIFDQAQSQEEKLLALRNIIEYYRKEAPDTVKSLAKQLLELAKRNSDPSYIYKAYNYLGVAYSTEGNLEAALENFLLALNVAEESNDLVKKSAIYNNLSYIYFVQRLYDKAIESLEQSLLIDQQRGDHKGVGITYNNLGIMYRALAQYDKAEESYEKALAIGYETKNDTAIANTEGNLSELYSEIGEYEKSLEKIDKALEASQRSGLDYITCVRLLNRGKVYNALKRYEEALEAVNSGITLAKRNNFQVYLRDGYGALTSIYESMGDYRSALEAYSQKANWQDSILHKDMFNQMAEMEAKYETKLKSIKIAQLEEEKSLHQTIIYWAIASAILFCIGLVLVFVTYTLRNKLLKKKNDELVIKHEAEQKIAILEKEKLQMDLEYKNRQVVSSTMMIAQKNEVLQGLKAKVKKISQENREPEVNKELKNLTRDINNNIELSDDWQHIKLHFEQVHPQFFENLMTQYPSLTVHEQKLCVYLRMKMTNKEISRLLNITPESVKVLKYRLKKKMMLPQEENMQEMLHHL
ncbi:hypothetical protein C900_04170 [Fulvivirga imtechensis AK7]|uniref:HTH luxR-type domain-containing protein n=1 Tax=Fulvivirga imtechensis AK7 TaxID=1237149 RepID=L8JYS7_9BACT|nr:tetratricopeptide repeat protein [Fulvivirga imtechensis]ELR73318.1 hypothetical protein C900_04170 [Fulvivirga imtechensis AK7]